MCFALITTFSHFSLFVWGSSSSRASSHICCSSCGCGGHGARGTHCGSFTAPPAAPENGAWKWRCVFYTRDVLVPSKYLFPVFDWKTLLLAREKRSPFCARCSVNGACVRLSWCTNSGLAQLHEECPFMKPWQDVGLRCWRRTFPAGMEELSRALAGQRHRGRHRGTGE